MDMIAECIVQLGRIAQGTVRLFTACSRLAEYLTARRQMSPIGL
jgi:hypothetical protein